MRFREKRKRRRSLRLKPGTSVNLISMMDILTVLLLFLLKSYVAEGEVMVPAPGLRLPVSTAEQTPRASLVVAIDGDAIRIGQETVASSRAALDSPDPVIEPLAAKLAQWRAGSGSSAGASDPRLVTIQGDRAIEYRLLRKVMLTLSRSGFENVSLAVLRNA